MDTRHILNMARRFITGLNEVQQNVYKGTLNVADKVAGVYYFDLNNQPLEDFEAYQERLLADEFYANPGNLQWNYYLFMLNDQLGEAAKERIEKNDKYARKYVLTENEFSDFFILEKSDVAIRPNIVADWKQRLEDAGLQDVYSMRTYVDLIAEFKNAGITKAKKVQEQRAADDVDKISFIDRLILGKDYRRYPTIRDYHFGKVNLFRGINGVGKTSLFEAIEAMICGKCLRNPSVAIAQNSIEAEFNHSNRLTLFDARDTRLYQSRDLNWYATKSRYNTLYSSFNRFNFFNADAAHNFSIATTEKDASEALFSIILGPEYHYISERCQGTLERLRPEYNKLTEQMEEAHKKEKRTAKIIEDYREPEALSLLRESVQQIYQHLKFKRSASPENTALIEERNNQLRAILTTLLSTDNTLLTLATFKAAYRSFEEKRAALNTKEHELQTLTERQSNQTSEEKRLNIRYDFLVRCLTYVEDEKLMKLGGLQAKEGAMNLIRSKILFVKNLIRGIDATAISIKLPAEQLTADINDLNKQIKNDETALTSLLSSLNKLEGTIRQIKSHGKEFLHQDQEAANCPLCQATYERAELVKQILQETGDTKNTQSGNFDELRQRIERSKETISKNECILDEQQKVKQAFQAAFPDQLMQDLTTALERLLAFSDQEDRIEQELYEFSEIKAYAAGSNRSEKEYNELKFACEQQLGGQVTFAYGEADAFHILRGETMQVINQCKENIEDTTIARTRVGNEIKRLLGVEGTSLYLRDIQQIIQKEEASISKVKGAYDSLQELVDLAEDSAVSELNEGASTLQGNILSLREEQKVQFEYTMATKEHAEAIAFISNNTTQLQKYERAVETLRALTGDEASAHVSAFFDDNFQEIVDIFKSIHVPKEFQTLKYTDDRLELITDSNERRSISQISTGQRSALALSIFLSLNGKLANGPDVIMFDDPVAFIDDLNALSFLDYLRLHTLRAGKQIFFATANMRLAGLFEKKFGFLNEDFRRFQLERSSILEQKFTMGTKSIE